MHRRTVAFLCSGVALALAPAALADREYTVHHGETVFTLDSQIAVQFGLAIRSAAPGQDGAITGTVTLQPFPSEEPLTVGTNLSFTDGEVTHYWGLIVASKTGQFYAPDIEISVLSQGDSNTPLQFVTSNVSWDPSQAFLQIDSDAYVASSEMAAALGEPGVHGLRIGSATTKVFLAQHNVVSADALGDNHNGPIGNDPPIGDRVCPESTGPDVIVGVLPSVANYNPVGGIDAFSVATTSCNVGTQNLNWIANDGRHPVIPQNLYRLKTVNGASRFEQIGQSWLKHGFTALTDSDCCACNGQGGAVLGVGCSDPYSDFRNGTQVTTVGGLGPRFQVNPHTGVFPFPYMFRNNSTYITHTSITRRLQVAIADLDPALNAGAQYFFEAQYVTPDDATAGNQNNNASYRTASISFGAGNANATLTGNTIRERAAIKAWKTADPAVVETEFDSPEGNRTFGRAILSAKATDLGGGQFQYEYALYNMNCDRAFGSFSIPIAADIPATDMGFHDVPYHSGDGFNSAPGNVVNYDGTDWPAVKSSTSLRWALVPATPVENSNALRWGTTYNFRFRSTGAPVSGNATLGLFKAFSGDPDTVDVATVVPGLPPPPPCIGDTNGDRSVDLLDLAALLTNYGRTAQRTLADGDLDGDTDVDINDLAILLANFGNTCPI